MKQTSRWFILALLALAQFMVVLDTAVANVALPAIQQSLNFDSNSLQWIVTAYALTFGGFLLLGGRAADLFGRRRVLLTGIVGFTIASLLIGIAQSSIEIIAFRAVQGVMAALMSPSALSIVLTTFREGKARNTAIGIWTTVAAGGAAAGLLVGGLLTQYLNWRWNFFINIPVGILTSAGILRYVPRHSSTLSHRHLDLSGALLVTSGLMTLVYGLTEAPHWGWLSSGTLSMFTLTIGLIAGFIWNESRVSHPLVPLSIFKVRNVSGANAMAMPVMAGMLGMFFLLSLYMQMSLRYTPVQTGLAFLPFPLVLSVISNIAPKLIPKFGFKPLLIAGTILLTSGLLWLTQLTPTSSYVFSILPAILAMATGMGISFVAITIAATSGVPANEAGLASGLLNTSQQMGGALGLAILSGVAASAAQSATNHTDAVLHGDIVAFATAGGLTIIALILAVVVIRPQQPPLHVPSEPTAAH